MKFALLRRLSLLLGLLAILGLLAVACGGEEEAGPTPAATTPAAGTPAGTPTPAAGAALLAPSAGGTAEVGGAGIASNPRQVPGLEGLLTLDDGLAAWKERPANEDRTGVTANTVKLGRVSSVTGVLASYEVAWGPAFQAYIKAINEAGGIHGRKLELTTRDDMYNPTLAVQVTKELVERDKVFAILNYASCATYDAVGEYLDANKVPNWYAWCGIGKFLYPTRHWSFSGAPDEQSGFGQSEAILSVDPDPKLAVVYMTAATGTSWLDGFKYALEKAGTGEVVAEVSFDPMATDLTAQAVQAAAADPDWVVYGPAPEVALFSLIRALRQTAGYEGKIFQGGTSPRTATSELLDGIYQFASVTKDGNNAPNDPQVLAVKKLVEEEGVRYDATFSFNVFTALETLVRALEVAGPDPTREGLIQAIYLAMDGSWKCAFCGEHTIIITPEDHSTDSSSRLGVWNHAKQAYDWLGPVMTFETSEGTGVIGNMPKYACQPPSANHPKGTCPWKSQ